MHPIETVQPTVDATRTGQTGAQRRELARVDAEFEVSFQGENNFYLGFSENISEGGLFVATAELRAIGERFSVKFKLPGIEDPCEAVCVVRWLRQPPAWSHDLPGMGLQFATIDAATQRLVERFIAKRSPLFVDDDALNGAT